MSKSLEKEAPKQKISSTRSRNPNPQQPSSLERIRGQIERITFQNEENGFTVAKMKVQGKKDLVTVTGNLPGTNAGEVLELWGEWDNHPKFGNQFKISRFKSVMPATAVGIQKYLGSGLIKGIGPVMSQNKLKSQEGPKGHNQIVPKSQSLIVLQGMYDCWTHFV